MGWNDHVEYLETECQQCGAVEEWTYWDEVGKIRYVGAIGKMVGQDASQPPHCPHCGATKGVRVEDEDDAGFWEC